ncbi:FAD-binding protein [Kitasatospora sp. MAP5-34]|uniref:FAD-binding protein n=1 Tax=Kitasatospora sp. MAP5-34 TaxID=3035102 RepID=UPI00247361A6|nr:FAD-binding protein [Kitasatospora sp. MAP5-34]MDH6576658.1 electron transfer flavoprotein alpha subunit [Kitasatospora sp. MAP5-34]
MSATPTRPLSVAVLVKQVPRPDELRLGSDNRLSRSGVQHEMNPYCRRAVAAGVAAAEASGGTSTVLTLGPPAAEDCLREAVAWGADRGVLITDPVFAGSDTLATARALAAALDRLGPFDLVLCGRNSVDADTAQMPAQLAELLDWPMAGGVRELSFEADAVRVSCEHDDGRLDARVTLPAVLTCAERLIDPAKVGAEGRAAVPADRILRLAAADLGPGPWGEQASPTTVGETRQVEAERWGLRYGGDEDEVRRAVALLACHDVFEPAPAETAGPARSGGHGTAPSGPIVVLAEPGRLTATRDLLGEAARLAGGRGGVVVLSTEPLDTAEAGRWGADLVVPVCGAEAEEDVATALTNWCLENSPWAVLAPSTMWGREVAARAAARLGAGLAGDAIELEADERGLVCWKPAFSGALVAAVRFRSAVQLATVRGGVLRTAPPRDAVAQLAPEVTVSPRGRVVIALRTRDDDVDALAGAQTVVAVGAGVAPEDYPLLRPLLDLLGAELAATRKVTDRGWQPRARQIGITGRSVAPRLFIAIGTSGRFNHLAGARGADVILAVNNDPGAPVFEAADVGLVADWRQAVPWLVRAVAALRQPVAEPAAAVAAA